jgi:hypothetical protein
MHITDRAALPVTSKLATSQSPPNKYGLLGLPNGSPSRERYSASEICFRLEADIDGIGIQTVGWTIK